MLFNLRSAQALPELLQRKPADWFNSIMDRNVPELADKIAKVNADAAVNALRLRIV